MLDQVSKLWSKPLTIQPPTAAPLVAGGRVFVLTADRLCRLRCPRRCPLVDAAPRWRAPGTAPAGRVDRPMAIPCWRACRAAWWLSILTTVPCNGKRLGLRPVAPMMWSAWLIWLAQSARVGNVICARAFQSQVAAWMSSQARTDVDGEMPPVAVGIASDAEHVFGAESNGSA